MFLYKQAISPFISFSNFDKSWLWWSGAAEPGRLEIYLVLVFSISIGPPLGRNRSSARDDDEKGLWLSTYLQESFYDLAITTFDDTITSAATITTIGAIASTTTTTSGSSLLERLVSSQAISSPVQNMSPLAASPPGSQMGSALVKYSWNFMWNFSWNQFISRVFFHVLNWKIFQIIVYYAWGRRNSRGKWRK